MLTVGDTAPKKAKGEKMDLGTFLQDESMRKQSETLVIRY